jgi:hypothetical protein
MTGGRSTRTGSRPLARASSSTPSRTRMPVFFQIVVRNRLRLWGYLPPNPSRRFVRARVSPDPKALWL